MNRVVVWIHFFSTVALWLFLWWFVGHNAPGMTGPAAVMALSVFYGGLYFLAGPGLLGRRTEKLGVGLLAVLYPSTVVILVATFLNATVWDYYQPLSLFDDAIAALACAWLLLIMACLVALYRRSGTMVIAALVALSGPVFIQVYHWLNNPQPHAALADHLDLFVGGEEGYAVYRIPALLVIPSRSQLASGEQLEEDRVIAFAEARLEGALDTGAIDLVQKTSADGGKTWSDQKVVCTHVLEKVRGKCGNATPVFDAQTGIVWLAYNLSGIPGDLAEGPRPHSAHIVASFNGGGSWAQPRRLPFDNFVYGPGHGIQKMIAPKAGRLIIPGYRQGASQVVYSDDGGQHWELSTPLDTGNESEVAELADGQLYMTTRHVAPIGRPPTPNGRLFSLSDDAGLTWSDVELDQALLTPICQASVLRQTEAGRLLFANPAHEKARVRMTLRWSHDDGAHWSGALEVYPGPAGYSQLAATSSGEVLLLYERGRVSYSERISLAKLSGDQLDQAIP